MEKRSLQHKAVPCGSKEGSNKAVYIVFVKATNLIRELAHISLQNSKTG